MTRIFTSLAMPLVALCAHATPVELPAVAELAAPKAGTAGGPPSRGRGANEPMPFESVPLAAYASGQRNEYGIAIDPGLASAYAAFVLGGAMR